MLLPLLLLALQAPTSWAVLPPPPPPPVGRELETTRELERTVRASAEAWNAGNLKGFIAFYEEDAVFLTAKGPIRGQRNIYERFRERYARQGLSQMGHLTFDNVFSHVLSNEWAVTYGRFHLVTNPAKPEQTGVFDLILHKTAQGWRIASDHTS